MTASHALSMRPHGDASAAKGPNHHVYVPVAGTAYLCFDTERQDGQS